MNLKNLFPTILFIVVFLELTLLPFPVVFLVSLVFYILYPTVRTVILVSVTGIFLDILNVSLVGQTTLAILIAFLILDLYKRAFEIKDWRVLLIMLFASTYIYAKIFSYPASLLVFFAIFGTTGGLIMYLARSKFL